MLLFTMPTVGDASGYKVKLKVYNLRIQKPSQPPSLYYMINY